MRALTLVILSLILSVVYGHGCVLNPRPRGIICPFHWRKNFWLKKLRPWPYCRGAPRRWDWKFHFPAGDKSVIGSAALRSQRRAAGRRGWTPYEPTRRGFVFRSGVCSDPKWGRQHHLKGGRFYWPKRYPKIVATYRQGGEFKATVKITKDAHHNGYFEFIVCNVKYCGGEISAKCLRRKNVCKKLLRKWEYRCELGKSRDCAPIDPNHPTRWYLPCSRTLGTGRHDFYKNIRFVLPPNFVCKHCVMQWYWVSANQCNPPGLVNYFRGPRGPKWWFQCRGQSGARGGYAGWMPTCGGKYFPEEYLACSDVRILRNRRINPRKPYRLAPPYRPNPLQYVQIYEYGRPVKKLRNGGKSYHGKARQIGIEVVTKRYPPIKYVYFSAEGSKPWFERTAPYFYGGNRARRNIARFVRVIRGKWFWLQATAVDFNGRHHHISVNLYF